VRGAAGNSRSYRDHAVRNDVAARQRIADAHRISVSSALSLPKSAGEPGNSGAAQFGESTGRLSSIVGAKCEGGTASMSNMPNCGPRAGAGGEPDPIFAAIERHHAALRIWRDAYDRLGALQDRSEFSEIRPHYTDAPEWIEANTAYVAAVEEVAKTLEILLSTLPTTITGVADLLDYVSKEECHPVVGATNYEPVLEIFLYRNLSANFPPMIAATLPRRANAEPDSIVAAIERHRAAMRGWLAAVDRRWALRQIIPEARRRWETDVTSGVNFT
jgi:hypothetical protein